MEGEGNIYAGLALVMATLVSWMVSPIVAMVIGRQLGAHTHFSVGPLTRRFVWSLPAGLITAMILALLAGRVLMGFPIEPTVITVAVAWFAWTLVFLLSYRLPIYKAALGSTVTLLFSLPASIIAGPVTAPLVGIMLFILSAVPVQ